MNQYEHTHIINFIQAHFPNLWKQYTRGLVDYEDMLETALYIVTKDCNGQFPETRAE